MKGFTLTELLISVAVGAAVGTLLLGIMVNNTGLYYKEASKIQQGVGSNDALASVRTNIKISQYVSSVYPEIGTPVYTSGANQLVLKLPTLDSSNNLVADTFDYVIYYISEQGGRNQLHMKLIPDVLSQKKAIDQILSNNVNSVVFDYYDGNGQTVTPNGAVKVKITLYLSQSTGNNTTSNIATTEASLRNN